MLQNTKSIIAIAALSLIMTGCGGGGTSSNSETTNDNTQETGQLESISIDNMTNSILTYEGSGVRVGTFCADNKVKLKILEDGSTIYFLGTRNVSGDALIVNYTQSNIDGQTASINVTSNDSYPNGVISLGDGDGDLVLIGIERVSSTECSL